MFRCGRLIASLALAACGVIVLMGGAAAEDKPKTAIFVDNDNYVTAYPLGSNGDVAPIALNTDMISPGGIARDAFGRIYVSNASTNTITVYPPNATGNVAPFAVIGGAETRLASPTAIALDASGQIYVLNTGTSAVMVYPPLGNGIGVLNEAPVAHINGPKTQLREPVAMTVDPAGDIFVANQKGGPRRPVKDYSPGAITIYSAGSNGDVAPARTIKGGATGLTYPVGITLDADGDVYVGNTGRYVNRKVSFPASIEVFSAGSSGDATPAAVIAGSQTNIGYPQGLALDSQRNIYTTGYVFNGNNNIAAINVYRVGSAGNVPPATAIDGPDTGLSGNAIALDRTGNLYVSNSAGGPAGTGSVTEYPAGSVGDAMPIDTITSSSTGIFGSRGIAVDASGKIYVVNQFDNSIGIYAAGTYGVGSPTATIAGDETGLSNPFAIALDSIGNIAALNSDNTVTIYPAGSEGDVMPSATIEVGNGGRTSPTAIALGPRGKLYVATQVGVDCNQRSCFQTGADSIAIYRTGSDGDAKPGTVISGPNTELSSPTAIALDGIGNIYVTNAGSAKCAGRSGSGSITVYAPGSNGDATPVAAIGGANTGLYFPYGIALDADGNFYVLNRGFGGGFPAIRLVPGVWLSNGCPPSNMPALIQDVNELVGTRELPSILVFGAVTRELPTILVFGAGSNGDTPPIAIIGGPFTALEGSGIAIGPAGP